MAEDQHREMRLAEELSAAIDALNRGAAVPALHGKNEELIEIAKQIQAENAVEAPLPPPAFLDVLAKEIQGQRHKPHAKWMRRGAAATAVVFLLALWQGAGFISLERQSAMLPPSPASLAGEPPVQELAPAPNEAFDQEKEAVSPKDLPISFQERDSAAEQRDVSVNPQTAASPSSPSTPKSAESSKPIIVAAREAAPVPRTFMAKNAAPEAVLVLPDRPAGEMTVDAAHGIVKTIYGAGTPGQIIVTQMNQMPSAQGEAANPPTGGKMGVSAAETAENNQVTVVSHGKTVTVEGKQSRDELMKIANSLMPQQRNE